MIYNKEDQVCNWCRKIIPHTGKFMLKENVDNTILYFHPRCKEIKNYMLKKLRYIK